MNLVSGDAGRYRLVEPRFTKSHYPRGVQSNDSIGMHVMIVSIPIGFTMIFGCFP